MKTTVRTKAEFEAMGFVFITLGGGAISASKMFKTASGETKAIGATAKTLPTLRKRLEEVINDHNV